MAKLTTVPKEAPLVPEEPLIAAVQDIASPMVLPTPAGLFMTQQWEQHLLQTLRHYCAGTSLANIRILDFGCITGQVLPWLYQLGFAASNLTACGLMKHHLDSLSERYPRFQVDSLRPHTLPYADDAFDIVIMFSVMSQVFDDKTRQHFADEAQRVLKHGGLILWYDLKPLYDNQREWQQRLYRWLSKLSQHNRDIETPLWLSAPTDHDTLTSPLDRIELRMLFSECVLQDIEETGLYQPVARRLAERTSWFRLALGAKLPVLKTHYYAELRKTIQ